MVAYNVMAHWGQAEMALMAFAREGNKARRKGQGVKVGGADKVKFGR
jgi:hypothetical protein